MLLTSAAVLSALGFGAWILGSAFEYPAIAVIGGVIVVGVGAMVTANGLRYQSGSTTDQALQTNQTVTNETVPIEPNGSGGYEFVPLTEEGLYPGSESVVLFNRTETNETATALTASEYNISYADGLLKPDDSVATTDDHVLLASYRYRLDAPIVTATEKRATYSAVDTPTRLPLGILWMLLGGLLVLRKLEDDMI